MNTLTRILAIMLMLAWAMPSFAQQNSMQGGMSMHAQSAPMNNDQMGAGSCTMQGAMMQPVMQQSIMEGAMHNSLAYSMMLVHMLPTMKEQLNLSDAQEHQFRQAEADYLARRQQVSSELQTTWQRVQNLTASEKPDVSALKKALHDAAAKRADLQVAGIETAVRMKAGLNTQQGEALASMSPIELHRYMMSNMTMTDMMNMMQGMYGAMHADGMMGGMQGMDGAMMEGAGNMGGMHGTAMGGGMMGGRNR